MIWKTVDEFPEYEVSDRGLIRHGAHIMKQHEDHKGYLRVKFGRKACRRVHRVVAIAFIDNPDGKPQVNHIDGNKKNNRADNLEWVTQSENMRHAYEHGLNHSNTTYVIRNDGMIYKSTVEAANDLGVRQGAISNALQQRQYALHGYTFQYFKFGSKEDMLRAYERLGYLIEDLENE